MGVGNNNGPLSLATERAVALPDALEEEWDRIIHRTLYGAEQNPLVTRMRAGVFGMVALATLSHVAPLAAEAMSSSSPASMTAQARVELPSYASLASSTDPQVMAETASPLASLQPDQLTTTKQAAAVPALEKSVSPVVSLKTEPISYSSADLSITTSHPKTVVALGDSLLDGDKIAGWDTMLAQHSLTLTVDDVKVGRPPDEIPALIDKYKAQISDPNLQAVVLRVGTNQGGNKVSFANRVAQDDAQIRKLNPTAQIDWVTPFSTPGAALHAMIVQRAKNIVDAADPAHGINAIEWDKVAVQHPELFGGDGYHENNYKIDAKFISDEVVRLLQAYVPPATASSQAPSSEVSPATSSAATSSASGVSLGPIGSIMTDPSVLHTADLLKALAPDSSQQANTPASQSAPAVVTTVSDPLASSPSIQPSPVASGAATASPDASRGSLGSFLTDPSILHTADLLRALSPDRGSNDGSASSVSTAPPAAVKTAAPVAPAVVAPAAITALASPAAYPHTAKMDELANAGLVAASKLGTTGNCLLGVNNADDLAGLHVTRIIPASGEVALLEKDPRFKEIPFVSRQQLKDLPAGMEIVWSATKAYPFGHIEITQPNDRETSDHEQIRVTFLDTGSTARIFYPVDEPGTPAPVVTPTPVVPVTPVATTQPPQETATPTPNNSSSAVGIGSLLTDPNTLKLVDVVTALNVDPQQPVDSGTNSATQGQLPATSGGSAVTSGATTSQTAVPGLTDPSVSHVDPTQVLPHDASGATSSQQSQPAAGAKAQKPAAPAQPATAPAPTTASPVAPVADTPGNNISAIQGHGSASAATNQQVARYVETNYKFAPLGTAFFLGDGDTESGFNPGNVGDKGKAEGIFQWWPDRRKDMPAGLIPQIDWALKVEMPRHGSQKLISDSQNPNTTPAQLEKDWYDFELYGVKGQRTVWGNQILQEMQTPVSGQSAPTPKSPAATPQAPSSTASPTTPATPAASTGATSANTTDTSGSSSIGSLLTDPNTLMTVDAGKALPQDPNQASGSSNNTSNSSKTAQTPANSNSSNSKDKQSKNGDKSSQGSSISVNFNGVDPSQALSIDSSQKTAPSSDQQHAPADQQSSSSSASQGQGQAGN